MKDNTSEEKLEALRKYKRDWARNKKRLKDLENKDVISPPTSFIDARAKDHCVRKDCKRKISKLLYVKNGNFCHHCVAESNKRALNLIM